MENNKLTRPTITHFAAYFPYCPMVERDYTDCHGSPVVGKKRLTHKLLSIVTEQGRSKLYLRPLHDYIDINGPAMMELNEDITTHIEINELARRKIGYWGCSYGTMQIMFKNHIDAFRLIEAGAALPIK